MNREKAEKLLAALIFDDLDETSKADLTAYLQTDDELRERLADMRMAAKVASDALLDGPDPVLDEQRLKHLAALAERGKRRPAIFRMRNMVAAAAILAVILLPTFLLMPSLHKAKRLSSVAFSSDGRDHDYDYYAKQESDNEFIGGTSLEIKLNERIADGYDVDTGQSLPSNSLFVHAPRAMDIYGRGIAGGVDYGGQSHNRGFRHSNGHVSFDGDVDGEQLSWGASDSYSSVQSNSYNDRIPADAFQDVRSTVRSDSSRSTVSGAGGMGGMGGGMHGGMGGGGIGGGVFQQSKTFDDAVTAAGPTDWYDKGVAVDGLIEVSTENSENADRITGSQYNYHLNYRVKASDTAFGIADQPVSSFRGDQLSTAANNKMPEIQKPLAPAVPARPQSAPKISLPAAKIPTPSEQRPNSPLEEVTVAKLESKKIESLQLQKQKPGNRTDVGGKDYNHDFSVGYQIPAGGVNKPVRPDGNESGRISGIAKANEKPAEVREKFFSGIKTDSRGNAESSARSRRLSDKDTELTDIEKEMGTVGEETVSYDRKSIRLGAIQEEVVSYCEITNSDGQIGEDESNLPLDLRFKSVPVNPWVMTERDALSTFALDVDTASYTLCRRYIRGGFLPPTGAVRMEEFINYFNYHYPQRSDQTFAVHAEAAPSPFAGDGKNLTLLKVGVKARTIGRDQLKPAHLVFVIDTSASMGMPDRLPLVQQSLNLLVDELSEADRVTLITCSDQARLYLEAASAGDRERIHQAINALQPSGSTNLLEGLKLGYATARRWFAAKQINHVVLCSDGVANVGQTEAQMVLKAVDADRKQGITVTSVGVGYGSYNDAFLESLANQGDGSYVFLDSSPQAQQVFVQQLAAAMHTVAKDARIQVSFDPNRIRRYRLIGYENRDIEDKRFRDDTIDAGQVGSGQCSTALYELELTGQPSADQQQDLGTVFVRYRDAETGQMEEISCRLKNTIVQKRKIENSPRFFLAAAAARFAEILRQSEHAQNGSLTDVLNVAEKVSVALPLDRDVRELAELIRQAEHLPSAQ